MMELLPKDMKNCIFQYIPIHKLCKLFTISKEYQIIIKNIIEEKYKFIDSIIEKGDSYTFSICADSTLKELGSIIKYKATEGEYVLKTWNEGYILYKGICSKNIEEDRSVDKQEIQDILSEPKGESLCDSGITYDELLSGVATIWWNVDRWNMRLKLRDNVEICYIHSVNWERCANILKDNL
jgi:hypothetical protein